MSEWCEFCQDHFGVNHFDDESGAHLVGPEYGPTGESMHRERALEAALASFVALSDAALQQTPNAEVVEIPVRSILFDIARDALKGAGK